MDMIMDTVNNILSQIASSITRFLINSGINFIVQPWMVIAVLLLILIMPPLISGRRRGERRGFLGSLIHIVAIVIILAALIFFAMFVKAMFTG